MNYENFANATEAEIENKTLQINSKIDHDDIIDKDFNTLEESKKPCRESADTAAKYILAPNQRQRWNNLIEKVPKHYRVYMKASFKQLKESQKDY